MVSTEFLITSIIVVLIPGTGVIYTLSTSLFLGRQAGIIAAVGCTLGIVPHLLASIVGLAALLHTSALAFQVVKITGALYLLYLAWNMWRETGSLALDPKVKKDRHSQIMIRGFLINILNPKLSLFFLAFLPLFVVPDMGSSTLQMLFLSAIFMLLTLGIFICYSLSASAVRNHVIHSPRRLGKLHKSFAAVFAMLGIKLLATEQ